MVHQCHEKGRKNKQTNKSHHAANLSCPSQWMRMCCDSHFGPNSSPSHPWFATLSIEVLQLTARQSNGVSLISSSSGIFSVQRTSVYFAHSLSVCLCQIIWRMSMWVVTQYITNVWEELTGHEFSECASIVCMLYSWLHKFIASSSLFCESLMQTFLYTYGNKKILLCVHSVLILTVREIVLFWTNTCHSQIDNTKAKNISVMGINKMLMPTGLCNDILP